MIVAVMLLTVVAVGIGLAVPVVYSVIAADNSSKIAEDLSGLKVALAGNARLVISGGRADFGFIGSMGNVPSTLPRMWLKGAQPAYAFDTTRKVGAGWVGPYIPSMFENDLLAMDKDRFGNDLIYTSTPFQRNGPGEDGQPVAARVRSAGEDGIANTPDDQLIDILQAEVYSTVTGTLRRGSNPVKFATVSLNIPSNGTLTQVYDVTDSSGVFSFSNVTFGFRSLGIDPKLTYEEGSITDPGNDRIKFTVTNFATNNIQITSIKPEATAAGGGPLTAYYEVLKVGSAIVFDWNNTTRAALGATINFAPITIKGSGRPIQVVPIRVEKQTTVTPDLLIRGVGKNTVIEIRELRTAATGGSAVDPSGSTFTISFSDGSQTVFTVP